MIRVLENLWIRGLGDKRIGESHDWGYEGSRYYEDGGIGRLRDLGIFLISLRFIDLVL